MMKTFTLAFCLAFTGLSVATITPANAGNKPCSGKKGGVKACTKGGKFVCRDGSISASKKRCR